MLPLCATGQSRVHYCCGSPQYKRKLIVFSMIDTLGLNANLFNLWLELITLMEVNLVFSNHPETRKEVLHFYDYSSRGYMLPILHSGDSIWQVLIEPVLNFTDNNGFLNLPIWILPSSALGINYRLNFERHFAAVCGVVRSGKATFSLVPMTSSTSQSHKGIGF